MCPGRWIRKKGRAADGYERGSKKREDRSDDCKSGMDLVRFQVYRHSICYCRNRSLFYEQAVMDRSGDRDRSIYHIQAYLETYMAVHRLGVEAMKC